MERSQAEQALLARFEASYALAATSVMRTICDEVCDCGHIGSSWTTRHEADVLVGLLGLGPQTRLLDLGAGAGWPGLHLVQRSRCRAVLADLPETGLAIARERAAADGIADRVETLVADAADLPMPDASFDAINHSDLLCCLPHKREVLAECRRLIRPDGRMVFSVLTVAPGLPPDESARAVESGPEFIEAGADYPSLLRGTGWRIAERRDLTAEYEAACARQIAADERADGELRTLLGADAAAERRKRWIRKLAAIRDRIALRELFLAEPASG